MLNILKKYFILFVFIVCCCEQHYSSCCIKCRKQDHTEIDLPVLNFDITQYKQKNKQKSIIWPAKSCHYKLKQQSNIDILTNTLQTFNNVNFNFMDYLMRNGLIKQLNRFIANKLDHQSNNDGINSYIIKMFYLCNQKLLNTLFDIQYLDYSWSKYIWSISAPPQYQEMYVDENSGYTAYKPNHTSIISYKITDDTVDSIINANNNYLLYDLKLYFYSSFCTLIDDFIYTDKFIDALILLNHLESDKTVNHNRKRINYLKNQLIDSIISKNDTLSDDNYKLNFNKLNKLLEHNIITKKQYKYMLDNIKFNEDTNSSIHNFGQILVKQ